MKELNKTQVAELVTQAAEDANAFGELYEYFFPKIYQYIHYRVNGKETAEDLVSDIFFKALRNLDSLSEPGDFQSWLFSIARNALIDHYRKIGKRREESTENIQQEPEKEWHTPEAHVLAAEESKEVMDSLKILSPEQQEVILLRFVHELKLKEIAEVIDKNESAVKGLLYRGLQKLSSHFADREVQT